MIVVAVVAALALQTPPSPAPAPAPAAPAPAAPAPAAETPATPPADAAAPADAAPPPAAAAPSVLPSPTKPRLLVLDLVDKGAGPEIAGAVNQAVSGQAVASFTLGDVVTQQQIKVALDAASAQALLGCESEQCMTDVGKTVEATTILGGSVSKVGDDVIITVMAVNARDGSRIGQQQRKVPVNRDLYYYAARQLTSIVLTGRAADPRVPVTINLGPDDHGDATFVVDGKEAALGQSAKVDLDPGSHEIRVRMSGKAEWKTIVNVEEATPVQLTADLVDSRITLWPVAIGTGALAVVAFGAFAWTGLAARDQYDGSLDLPLPGFEPTKESSYLNQEPVDSKTLYEKQGTVEALSLAANITVVTGAVLLVATAALVTTDFVLNASAE